MNAPAKKGRLSSLEFIATFLILFFALNWGLRYFFPEQFGGQKADVKPVELVMEDASVTEGNNPVVVIHNRSDKDLVLPARCPQPPVDVAFAGQNADGETLQDLMANQTVSPCVAPGSVKAKSKLTVELSPWKYSLFQQLGTYQLSLDVPEGYFPSGAERISTRFTIEVPGFFTKIFRTFISKPLFNLLVLIAAYVPGHNLGLAIILLTVLVKLLLLIPNQHALKSQKKMQQLQPRLDELKKKYGDDSKRLQEETLKLWKDMKINPLESCLPIGLQFPILIGLFYAVRDGGNVAIAKHLLYAPLQDLPWSLTTNFAGLDLLQPNLYFFPPLLVILQFLQMRMMFQRQKAKAKPQVIEVGKKSWMPELNQQAVMQYALPLMIGFFAIKFPAAVSLYWGISTLFAIAQQWYVMREK